MSEQDDGAEQADKKVEPASNDEGESVHPSPIEGPGDLPAAQSSETSDAARQAGAGQAKEQAQPTAKQAPRSQNKGRFRLGQSGNPSGRRRGAVSKQTIAVLVREHGSPLEFLLKLMSDDKAKLADRVDAAKAALPYTNRRLPEFAPDKVPALNGAEEDAEIAERERLEKVRREAVARAAARKAAGLPPEQPSYPLLGFKEHMLKF